MDQLKNLHNPFPWLVRILINECNSFQKRGWREILSAVLPERSIDSVEDTYLNLEQNNRIYEAILSLPTIYRIPIVLFYFEDMSIEQIANTLDNNANSIKTRLFRGRERLRKLLKEDDTYGKSNQSCETAL
jgi:RNA polymerase sigma-70 factor, ECF subfamily